jgi:hypothetical protein
LLLKIETASSNPNGKNGFINIFQESLMGKNRKCWLLMVFPIIWQEGYGAFSYSHSQIDHVIKYIMNQKEHHRSISFREEYIDFLKKFEIEHDEKYLFEWIEKPDAEGIEGL